MIAHAIYLIRHGETEDNIARRITGQGDSPLTERGREQAAGNGRLLREIVPSLGNVTFVASTLGRARATMELVLDAAGLRRDDFLTDARLMEANHGRWTGRTVTEVYEERDREIERTGADSFTWRWPGGESRADLLARVDAFLRTLERDTVLVGHAGSTIAARGLMLGLPHAQIWQFEPKNAGIIAIRDSRESLYGR